MRRSILADGFWLRLASAASDMIRSYVGLRVCLLRCLGGYLQIGDKKRYKLQNERNGTRLRCARSSHPMQVSIMNFTLFTFELSISRQPSRHSAIRNSASRSLRMRSLIMARPRHEEAPSEEAAAMPQDVLATRCAAVLPMDTLI